MDIKHHKELETIAGRTSDGVSVFTLVRSTLSVRVGLLVYQWQIDHSTTRHR
jgi:hypothetical protein